MWLFQCKAIKQSREISRLWPTTVHAFKGEEYVLQQVEEAWNSVAVQTAWKLEPAYQYEDDAGQSDKMNKVPSLHIPMLAIGQCPQ